MRRSITQVMWFMLLVISFAVGFISSMVSMDCCIFSIVARIMEDRETRPFVCWLDLDVTDEDRVDCHERTGRVDCRCARIEAIMNAFEHVQELYVFVPTDETVEYFDAPLTEPALTAAVRAGRGPRARINIVSLESVAVPAITDELVAKYAPPSSERRAEYWPAHGLE